MNYAVSLAVLASALAWRARAAMLKALSMMGFGLYVLSAALWSVWNGGMPLATTMGAIALVALVANIAVAWMLYAFREGDANMRSVWLCSRNDAIGNLAVFGLEPPDEIVQDMIRNMPHSAGYTDSKGLFAPRKAVVHYTQEKHIRGVTVDDVYLGNGASELITM
eukprot:gene18317-24950_t